jgi:YfdX protein
MTTATTSHTDSSLKSGQFHRVSSEARSSAQAQSHPGIEKQRQQTEQNARNGLDREAILAIEETIRAVRALEANQATEALAAIERASGKLDILLARNPDTALIPVDAEVVVIDLAPQDNDQIMDLGGAASIAVDAMDFPDARSILRSLMSEIRTRTYNLPLATYPTALRDAARLLDQKKAREANAVLLTALGTLVATDRVQPIPLLLAGEAIAQAQIASEKDKTAAQNLVETARQQLDRSRYLGYAGKDPEYKSLQTEIKNLEKQLKANQDGESVFAKLKEKLDRFIKRQSDATTGADRKTRRESPKEKPAA